MADDIGTWKIERTFEKSGKQWNVWVNEDDDELALLEGKKPDKATVEFALANGMIGAIEMDENDTRGSEPEMVDDSPQTAFDRSLAIITHSDDPESRAQIRLYEISDKTPTWCEAYTPEEWEEGGQIALIRKHFGSGTFRIEVWGTTPRTDANGQRIKHGGKFVRMGAQTVKVAAPITPTRPGEFANNPMDAVAPMMREMRQQQETFMRMVADTLKGKNDPMVELERLVRLQTLMNPQGDKQPSLAKLISEMDALETLRTKMGAGKGDNESPNDLMGMAGKFMEILPSLANRQGAQPAQHIALPNSLSGSPEQSQNTIEQSQQETDVNAFQSIAINSIVSALSKAAANNEDVTEHARGLLGMLPEEMIGILGLPGWFDILSDLQPKIADKMKPHMEWWQKMRDSMLAQLDAAGGMDEPE